MLHRYAIDKYGNVDNSPSSFNWTVTSLEEGIQEMIDLDTRDWQKES